jgi:hypothetical protein
MDVQEFNLKYKDYIEEGFDGLEFYDEQVIDYLDNQFREFIKVPDFKFAQIKLKFGMCCFYADNVNTYPVESEINKILKEKKLV